MQMLKRENKSAMEAFHEAVKKELSHVNSPCDSTEEAGNLKGEFLFLPEDIYHIYKFFFTQLFSGYG
jgi:hypothetical protein